MDYADMWQGDDGLWNVVQGEKRGRYPELPGFDPRVVLKDLVGSQTVCEVGCGYGRLASAFTSDQYIGVDCNRAALLKAEAENPQHRFERVEDYTYPASDVAFAYTVAWHIPPEEIQQFVAAICKNRLRVIIAEHFSDTKWQLPVRENPVTKGVIQPFWARTEKRYEEMFTLCGFYLYKSFSYKYPRISVPFMFLEFRS